MKRIFDNKHVDRYVMSDEDRLRSCHSKEEVIRALHLDVEGQFDSDDSSKDFSVAEIQQIEACNKEVVPVYDSDRVKYVLDKVKEKENELAEQEKQ